MKKRIVAALMAAVLALGMMACGSPKEEPSQAEPAKEETAKEESPQAEAPQEAGEKEPVTLRYYNYELSEAAKAAWWEETIANFEAEYDWITIEPITVDFNSMVNTLTNDLASGLTADVIYGETGWVPALVDAGFIQPPANVLSKDFYDGYYDYVMEVFMYDGEYYSVPHYCSNNLIFVNKDLVEGAGLSMDQFPETLDDLKQWIETLADFYKDNQNISTIFGVPTAEVPASGADINAMFLSFGGTLIDENGNLADLKSGQNATAMSEMLDFYKYLIGNGYTQENQKLKDYRAAFGAGNVCMFIDSAWGFAQIGEVDPNASSFTVTAPVPKKMGTYGEGKNLIATHNFLYGADMNDAHKEAADLFTQYCTSAETLQKYLTEVGLAFPAHKSTEAIELSPILVGASKGVDNVQSQKQIGSIMSVQVQLATMVLNYSVNGMSEEDAVNDYIQQAEYYINQ